MNRCSSVFADIAQEKDLTFDMNVATINSSLLGKLLNLKITECRDFPQFSIPTRVSAPPALQQFLVDIT
jgi:hypothetical protein